MTTEEEVIKISRRLWNELLSYPVFLKRSGYIIQRLLKQDLKNNVTFIELQGNGGRQAYVICKLCQFFGISIGSYRVIDSKENRIQQFDFLQETLEISKPQLQSWFSVGPISLEDDFAPDFFICHTFAKLLIGEQDIFFDKIVETARHGLVIYDCCQRERKDNKRPKESKGQKEIYERFAASTKFTVEEEDDSDTLCVMW